jgi:PAS domain S-box-containing protein
MEGLTSRSKKELVNVPVEATYVEEEQSMVRKKLVDETIEKGYMHGFVTRFIRPDGIKVPIVANTALLRDKKGKPLSIIYSATGVTKIKKSKP